MDPQELEVRYRHLVAAHRNGSLSQEKFLQACQELRLQDQQGIWWTIEGASGAWLYYDASRSAWLPPADGRGPAPQAASLPGLPGADTSGIVQAAAVIVLSAVLSFVLWTPFSWLPRIFLALVPPGNCSMYREGTPEMYLCSAMIAVFILLVPLLTALCVFLLRRQLAGLMARNLTQLPEGVRFLVAPALSTLFFVIVWAGAHYQTGGHTGFVPQKAFPALIGLFTFLTGRYGPEVQRSLSGFFAGRDKVPKFLRIVAVVLVPTLLALVITNQRRVTDPALKEQLVVLVGLVMGYLMLVPRSGDLLAGIKGLMARKGQQP